jgi:oxygen-independent coproporphyrinogen-3 oxidase
MLTIWLDGPLEDRIPVVSARSAYLHVPFCTVRCGYCDFNTYTSMEGWMPAYVAALTQEIGAATTAEAPAPLDTIFIGGGTPSLLPGGAVRTLMQALNDAFGIAPSAEVSLEANPCSITPEKLEAWLAAGVNRLSIGVQSLDAVMLHFLDRQHSADQALQALRLARAAGFGNLSADLIYGIPGLTLATWMRTVEGVLTEGPDHVSMYELTVEAGTPLAQRVAGGDCRLPDAEAQLEQYWTAADRLATDGWEHYEISNWARPGRACRHNLAYWRAEPYFGLGAGAHGMRALPDGGIERYWNVRRIPRYVERVQAGGAAVEGCERLDAGQRAREAAMLGVRLLAGMPATVPVQEFAPAIARLTQAGLLHAGAPPRLTRRGVELASEVGRTLLAVAR